MYNAQNTKDRIKQLCKLKKINVKQMLIDCSLGANAIQQINDTKGMASFSLAKIADYLNCSVDYLLGRTDTPLEESCNDIVLTQMEKQVLIGYRKTDDLTKEMVHRVLHIEEKRDSEKMA